MKLMLMILTSMVLMGCAEEPRFVIDKTYVMGDSISIGYAPFIAKSEHNPGNASSSQYTRDHVETWLDRKLYKSIVFNNGLHDIVYAHTSLAAYRANMEAVADVVLRHTANPVFVLSSNTLEPGDFNAQVQALNAIALEVMSARGIPVVDLYTLSQAQSPNHYDEIHFNDTASQVFAQEISKLLP